MDERESRNLRHSADSESWISLLLRRELVGGLDSWPIAGSTYSS